MPPLREKTRAMTHVFSPIGSHPGHDETCPKNLSGETPDQDGGIIRAVQEHRNARNNVLAGSFVQLFAYCDGLHI